jgi:hypothetical protein
VSDPSQLPPVVRRHLDRLSHADGIREHAIGSDPDSAHGSCTDDVARALQVDLLHARTVGWPAVAASAWGHLRFLGEAFDDLAGRFRNVRRPNGSWAPTAPSADSQGRAMLALGTAIATAPDARMVAAATALFGDALPNAQLVRPLRARASVLLAVDAVHHATSSRDTGDAHRRLSTDLLDELRRAVAADPAWPWPEERLTYENARPARALIVAGRSRGSTEMTQVGLSVLDWLVSQQTAPEGHLSPIGNGWWTRDGERARFDQQPIEATSILLAAEAAFVATRDPRYREIVERAYAWFLGANDVGVPVADPDRGASFDGLTPTGVNTNQGAESTLMWLTAVEHVRALREAPPGDPGVPAGDASSAAATAPERSLVGAGR